MLIRSILIKDFLSFKEADITFPTSGMTLIEGWNHDKESSNGAGKSSILSAITWCLYGKLPRSISASAVCRHNEKKTNVSVLLEDSDSKILITRLRDGSSSSLTIKIDENDSAEVSQETLESIIKISYDRFLQICYFAQGLGQRFLDLSDTAKKQLFLDLSSTIDYPSAKLKIDSKLKELIVNKQKQEIIAARLSAKIDEILSFASGEEELSLLLQDYNKKIDKYKTHINKLEHSISEPDISSHKELMTKLKQKLSEIQEAKGELKQLHIQLRKVSQPINPPKISECPHCSSSISILEDGEITQCDESAIKQAYSKLIDKQNLEISSINKKIANIDPIVSKEHRVLEAIEACEGEISEATRQYVKLKSDLESARSILRSTIDIAASTEKELLKTREASIRISQLNKEFSELNISLNDTDKQIAVLEAASHVLGPSGIQAYVLDSIIDQFNEYIREITSKTWPGLSYELKTFKENKTGSISTRFSESVILDNRQCTIGALSGGERKCLSIAIDIALTKTFFLYSGKVFGPLMLDEPFDHMDSINRERAVSLLQEVASELPVIVVDHANEVKGLFDNIILVTKKNGISAVSVE